MTFGIYFGAILAPSWGPKWSQNQNKRVLKKWRKNGDDQDGQKLDIGGDGGIRHHGFESRGGIP